MNPLATIVVEITVPTHADPIKFKTLNRKFTGHILQVVGRSDIRGVIEKPVNRLDVRLDVYAFGPKALSTRGRDKAETFGSAGSAT